MRGRRAEECHDRVSDELLDGAAVALELGRTGRVWAEDGAHLLGIELLGLRGEADEVAEEDGDDLALFARARVAGAACCAPHIPHRRNPSGFSWPQLGQVITGREYGVRGQ